MASMTVRAILSEDTNTRASDNYSGKGLTVFGNMLYVLVEMANFQSRSTIGEYFVVEYNLEKRRDIAERVTSIDISVQTIEKEEEKKKEPVDATLTIPPQFILHHEDAKPVSPTWWKVAYVGVSEKYFVLALNSHTSVYWGMSNSTLPKIFTENRLLTV